jgi:hypothetical protein
MLIHALWVVFYLFHNYLELVNSEYQCRTRYRRAFRLFQLRDKRGGSGLVAEVSNVQKFLITINT